MYIVLSEYNLKQFSDIYSTSDEKTTSQIRRAAGRTGSPEGHKTLQPFPKQNGLSLPSGHSGLSAQRSYFAQLEG